MINIEYKGVTFVEQLKFDILVDGVLLLEVKAVQEVLGIHKAQLLSYMKLLDVPLGLVMNFHAMSRSVDFSRMALNRKEVLRGK